MPKQPRFAVGQTVIETHPYRHHAHDQPHRQTTVEKVGRLYVTTSSGRRFSIEHSRESIPGDYSSDGAVFTLDEWAERPERAALYAELERLGVTTTIHSATAYRRATVAQLRAIRDTLADQ